MSDHILIVGAGPAGLGAARGAALSGARVTVFERGEIGALAKGETLHYSTELEHHLGPGCYDEFSCHFVSQRIFKTPGGREKFRDNKPLHITEWHPLLKCMQRAAEQAGARVLEHTEITAIAAGPPHPILLAGDTGYESRAVILADGPESRLRPLLGMPPILSYPITKELRTGYSGQQRMLELHADFDGRRPGVYFVFPRGDTDVEIGYMIFMDGREGHPLKLLARHLSPHQDKIPKAEARIRLESILSKRPELSAPLQDSRVTFTYTTYLPMPRIEPELVPRDHIFMVGDVAGTVEGRGGSGVLASYLLGVRAGQLAAESLSANWKKTNLRHQFNRTLRQHPAYQKVLRTQQLPIPFVQTYLRQNQHFIETLWPVFSRIL